MAAKWIASQLVEVNPASASHGPSNSITHLYSSDVVLLAEAYSYRSPTFNPTAFGYLEQCGPGSAFEGVLNESFEASCVSPLPTTLTPSLCGDRLQTHRPSSPELSLRSPKRETLSSHPSPEVESEPKRPQRKRAPARLDRTLSDGLSGASAGSQRTTRLQHSLVERKYREGLNAGLERLRRAVPMLSRGDVGSVMGEAKPSKAMVLAGAIDYIKKVEQERDMLQDENARLRGISKGTVARLEDNDGRRGMCLEK